MNHRFTLMNTDYTEKQRQKRKALTADEADKLERESKIKGKGKSKDTGFLPAQE